MRGAKWRLEWSSIQRQLCCFVLVRTHQDKPSECSGHSQLSKAVINLVPRVRKLPFHSIFSVINHGNELLVLRMRTGQAAECSV